MNLCIATIRNKRYSILKYRILNIESGHTEDIHARSIGNKIQSDGVRNLAIVDNKIQCIEGDLDNYPAFIDGTNKAANANTPIIVTVSDTEATLANFKGNMATAPLNIIFNKIKTFANGSNIGGKLVIAQENQNRQRVGNKTTEHRLLNAVMQADSKVLDIRAFSSEDYKARLDIGKTAKMPLVDLVKTRVYNRNKVDDDKSAYSFDIVRDGNKVIVKKYIGAEYTGMVTVPDGVTHIEDEVFKNIKAEEVVMPDSVIYIGQYLFSGAHTKRVKLSSKITAIPLGCFFDSCLEDINLEAITSIDNMAFTKCNIKEVKLAAPIIQIGFDAFKGCQSLFSFEHAKTITKIRNHAFEDCINLTYFDFSSVTTIEQYAFHNTGIKKAVLNGEVNYLQTGTFTGDIEEIELLDGFYKIAADSVSSIKNKPIIWTIPNTVTNIEKNAIKQQDTVICYRKSVAASAGILAEAKVVYLDDIKPGEMPKIFVKAKLIDADVAELLEGTLTKLLNQEDSTDITYDIDESKVVRLDIPDSIQEIIPEYITCDRYATDDDIKAERVKFKCILEHLYRSAPMDITPFASVVLALKDTFRVAKKSKIDTLYDDGVSKVVRITYLDNKFISVNSSFIAAMTYNTLRYICMDNKYTDIMCEDKEVIDLTKLLEVLRPGDTIGLNSILSGAKYPEIVGESNKQIEVTKNGVKRTQKLKMNMYQALRYSSVTVKLDNNNIALLLPGNGKVVKCASLGKTVWLNEKEDTYSSLQATIESIEDIGDNTVFDCESTHNISNVGGLLKRFISMKPAEYAGYIEKYSHIYPAEPSMYRKAGAYASKHGIKGVEDADLELMLMIFETELFETRNSAWLERSINKTIVPDAQFEFVLSDGSVVRQYRTVKKTALRNKLMVGGDRKLYIFDVCDSYGVEVGVYISIYDIETLVNMCLDTYKFEGKHIFEDKKTMDYVDGDSVIEIASLCRGSKMRLNSAYDITFVFFVYSVNGLFYIGYKVENERIVRYIPLIQIGELEVALEFIEDTNKVGLNNESMRYLNDKAKPILYWYFKNILHLSIDLRGAYNNLEDNIVFRLREMCIDGISDIKYYNNISNAARVPEILKRCLGYNKPNFDYYSLDAVDTNSMLEDLDSLEDLGQDNEYDIGAEIDDLDMDFGENEISDI